MKIIKATIIILDFMKARQIIENVNSLLKQGVAFKYKIIVVDNSCNKANADILKELEKIENVEVTIDETNIGYAKAHNQFNNKIEGDYIVIVNPDIEWKESDALEKMINYMDKNIDIGILGPKQIENNGGVAITIRAFPKFYLQVARRTFLRKLSFFKSRVEHDEMRHLDYDKIQEVDWLQSSCVVVRRSLWEKTSGLCEDYFLFMSDVEICYKAWERGYRVVYYPVSCVWADGKRVSDGGFMKFFQSWILRTHVRDSLRYRIKHLFQKNPREESSKNKRNK